LVLALFAKLPDATADLSPWIHWRTPVVVKEVGAELGRGPMLVTVEYVVAPDHREEFLEAIYQYGRIRRRDGASRWEVFRNTEHSDHYLEIFLVDTWAEHLRQHERETKADHALEQKLRSYVVKEPEVRHLILAHPSDGQ
jgi:hypothetical protein